MKTGQTGDRLCVLCAFYHVVLTHISFFIFISKGESIEIFQVIFFSFHAIRLLCLFFFNIAMCDFWQTTKQVEEELAKVVGKE